MLIQIELLANLKREDHFIDDIFLEILYNLGPKWNNHCCYRSVLQEFWEEFIYLVRDLIEE